MVFIFDEAEILWGEGRAALLPSRPVSGCVRLLSFMKKYQEGGAKGGPLPPLLLLLAPPPHTRTKRGPPTDRSRSASETPHHENAIFPPFRPDSCYVCLSFNMESLRAVLTLPVGGELIPFRAIWSFAPAVPAKQKLYMCTFLPQTPSKCVHQLPLPKQICITPSPLPPPVAPSSSRPHPGHLHTQVTATSLFALTRIPFLTSGYLFPHVYRNEHRAITSRTLICYGPPPFFLRFCTSCHRSNLRDTPASIHSYPIAVNDASQNSVHLGPRLTKLKDDAIVLFPPYPPPFSKIFSTSPTAGMNSRGRHKTRLASVRFL